MARAPRAQAVDGVPAEPDLLEGVDPPRAARCVIGHRSEITALTHSFKEAPPQAILFAGPRGIGKATLAFRLAKVLLSNAPLTADLESDPGARDVSQIVAGTHPSLLHLTRAYDDKAKRFKTELSVDTVRRIVPFLGNSAAGNGWRVVIVDAVDDMNANAANALLKSLEEPPRQTVFVLIAHVPGRVLPTIRSRCRTLRFRALPNADVREVLKTLKADPALADSADGSVRRALMLAGEGARAVLTAKSLLSEELADGRRRFAVADLAAQKRGEHFAIIADLILDAIAARTRRHAAAAVAPLDTLDAFATTYLDALVERRRVEIFNLDRKEFALALLDRLAAADRRANSA